MVRESYWDYMGRRMREERGQTYVSSTILDELYCRVKALEYRASQHDQDINALDWEVRGEDGAYEEPEQLEMDV
jgi:hypothetical protein